MTPEGKVLSDVRKMLDRRRVLHMKMHGGPMSRAGVPDLLLCIGGRLCWLEVKAPGEKPTKLQAAFLDRWREAGCLCEWVDSAYAAELFVIAWGG